MEGKPHPVSATSCSGNHHWRRNGAGGRASGGADGTPESKAGDAANGASGNGFLGPGAAHSSSSQSHDNKKRERPHHQNFPLTENYRGQFLTTGESLARSPLTAEPANSASPVITTVRCMRHHRRRGARAERNLVTGPSLGVVSSSRRPGTWFADRRDPRIQGGARLVGRNCLGPRFPSDHC